jgi:hypothetical protein
MQFHPFRDTGVEGAWGGTGVPVDWELLNQVLESESEAVRRRLILAGGLAPYNVREAINLVKPFAVDVSTGVEVEPGIRPSEDQEVHECDTQQENQAKWPDPHGYFGNLAAPCLRPLVTPCWNWKKRFSQAAVHQVCTGAESLLRNYAGRETPLFCASRLSEKLGGGKLYLKREDLLHTGAHKINNTLGQALLAKHMGKLKVIAETGAGQHGVATAAAAALLGLECRVFMGEEDMRRQAPNVFRMRLMGTEVVPVTAGTATLKDAMSEAMRYWAAHIHDTFYVIGSVAGPHPYPLMVREFQSIIGRETRRQILEAEDKLPRK